MSRVVWIWVCRGGREETKEVGRVREEEEFREDREDRYFGVEWRMGRE